MSNSSQQINVTVRETAPGSYDVTFDPSNNVVTKKNTTLVYQLTSGTPAGVRFTGMTAPGDEMGPATIGDGGRSLSFKDKNSKKDKVKIRIDFEDTISFYAMPEVINDPEPTPP